MEWEQAWLAYRPLKGCIYERFFRKCQVPWGDPCAQSALRELTQAAKGLFGFSMRTVAEDPGIILAFTREPSLGDEGFCLSAEGNALIVRANTGKGLLYGTYALLHRVICGQEIPAKPLRERPQNPLRMLNHWDNIDGSIERGYSGRSFFMKDNELFLSDRTRDYARLLASVGINATVLNNVNVKGNATWLIDEKYLPRLREIENIFAEYGISLYLSLNFAAPMELGDLPSADPLAQSVIDWWQARMAQVYEAIPRLGGFLVKADSEGRPGPFTYGRTHADGANLLARAVKPYGGRILWRCFVYNCQQDWRDRKVDRARAAFDNFMPLDGLFDENVILQIKNGPMDFQVREPVNPLFGGLQHTNMMLEVQAAQEYTGQQRHVCYLAPMWKQILSFHTLLGQKDTVAQLVSGEAQGNTNGGMAAVSNTGDDANWTGHDLAGANLYAFGRLAWDPSLSAEGIAREWIALALTHDAAAAKTIEQILMRSWPVYESYNAPLGIGWMCNPHEHYGPSVDGYEYDRWGTYHRADHLGIGVDRSAQGTGYALLYNGVLAKMYDDVDACPEELLLFFHHVPFARKLSSGKTVLQHIYDTHFDGAAQVQGFIAQWESVQGAVPEPIYTRVLARLQEQAENAREWRDVINTYFYRLTLIPDEQGRTIY